MPELPLPFGSILDKLAHILQCSYFQGSPPMEETLLEIPLIRVVRHGEDALSVEFPLLPHPSVHHLAAQLQYRKTLLHRREGYDERSYCRHLVIFYCLFSQQGGKFGLACLILKLFTLRLLGEVSIVLLSQPRPLFFLDLPDGDMLQVTDIMPPAYLIVVF